MLVLRANTIRTNMQMAFDQIRDSIIRANMLVLRANMQSVFNVGKLKQFFLQLIDHIMV
jgi:hypothetical protein